ncbi:unnamed protein product, partial [Closterium sp. NIES-54]
CVALLAWCHDSRSGLKVAVAGIPKTMDNDIAIIDRSFGFDTAVEEAQRAIYAAHVEAESTRNGVGLVKLMGRYCGQIAMHATLASRDVVCGVLGGGGSECVVLPRCTRNGVGLLKLMGRYCGQIAMHATLASWDVVCAVCASFVCASLLA